MNISLEKLQHIAAYAAQQNACGLTAHIPPHDMVALTELAMLALRQAQQETDGWQARRPGGQWFTIKGEDAEYYIDDDAEVRTICAVKYFTRGVIRRELEKGTRGEIFVRKPAPAVPEEMTYVDAVNFVRINGMSNESREGVAMRTHNACRAAMLQQSTNTCQLSGNSEQLTQDVQSEPKPDPLLFKFYKVNTLYDLVMAQVEHIERLQDAARRNVKPWQDTFPPTLLPAYIERIKLADEAARAELATNSPVIPDGWKLVPVEPTEAMLLVLGMTGSFDAMIARYQKMLAAAPQSEGGEA